MTPMLGHYERGGGPGVASLAIPELVANWGERARPVLLAVLQMPDEGVKIAALNGLRDIGNVDGLAIQKVEPLRRRSRRARAA
jgi:hypothetical protein